MSRSLGVSNGRKSEEGWLYAYVDLLNKVFVNAQILGMILYIILRKKDIYLQICFIELHLNYIADENGNIYNGSTYQMKQSILRCLKHTSKVFSNSVCRFVLVDLDVLISKYTKRSNGVGVES